MNMCSICSVRVIITLIPKPQCSVRFSLHQVLAVCVGIPKTKCESFRNTNW